MEDRATPTPAGRKPAPGRSRRRVLIELSVVYGLILTVIWTPRPWQRWDWWVAAAAVVVFTWISYDGRHAMGLRLENFFPSLWIVAAALALTVGAALVARHLHTLRLPGGPIWVLENYWAYMIWAAVQQFLLQCFFFLRLRRLISGPRLAAFAAALLFSSAHLPNPILAPITLVWGFVACLLFLRYRNLYSLALAHGILGIAVAITVPGHVDHNMRVGLGYLRYNPHVNYRRHHWMDRSPQP